jgi:chemotaxis protein histidine kinase CheA
MSIKDTTAVVFDPPTLSLRAKLRIAPGAVPTIDPELLKKAEAAVESFGDSYREWAKEDVAQLDALYQRLRAAQHCEVEAVAEIRRVAFEMKGHGGSFGYRLMTEISRSLEDFAASGCEFGPRTLDVIGAHVDAMRAVLRDDIRGDGGEVGRALLAGLRHIVQRMSAAQS